MHWQTKLYTWPKHLGLAHVRARSQNLILPHGCRDFSRHPLLSHKHQQGVGSDVELTHNIRPQMLFVLIMCLKFMYEDIKKSFYECQDQT